QASHEALATGIVEPRTEGEKGRRGEQTRHRPAQHHREVLHEFHIHQVYSGTQCHGHPIPSDASDVGRLSIHLAAPPSRENGRPSVDDVRLPMAAMYPYGPIAAPVLDEQFLQHDMVEHTNTTLIDLLAYWAGDLGRDVLDCVAPAWPLVAGRWLCLDTACTREKRRPPGYELCNASTRLSGQGPHHGLMIHIGSSMQGIGHKEFRAIVEL